MFRGTVHTLTVVGRGCSTSSLQGEGQLCAFAIERFRRAPSSARAIQADRQSAATEKVLGGLSGDSPFTSPSSVGRCFHRRCMQLKTSPSRRCRTFNTTARRHPSWLSLELVSNSAVSELPAACPTGKAAHSRQLRLSRRNLSLWMARLAQCFLSPDWINTSLHSPGAGPPVVGARMCRHRSA